MKKSAAKITAAVLALAILLPLQRLAAGESVQPSPALAPAACAAQKPAVFPRPQTDTAGLANAARTAAVQPERPEETSLPQTAAPAGRSRTASQEPAGGPVGAIEFGGAWAEAAKRGIHNLTSAVVDTGWEYPELIFEYDDDAGVHRTVYIGLYVDEANGILIGRQGEGAFRSGFDFDTRQRLMFASYNGWERGLGFCALYDALAPLSATLYDTQRVKFSYGGRDWMFQIWKGFYFGFLTGAELGLYTKPESRPVEFYDCVEDGDMAEMSMGLSKGDTLLFERQAQVHWWMNGFVPAGPNPARSLTLEGSVRFEDPQMLAAFLEAFDAVCARAGISYGVEDGLVSFTW